VYGISPRWTDGGDPDGQRMRFRPGWNTVELHYRMNTPGQNDGVHRGWLNGVLGVDLHDVQYRTRAHPKLDINQVFASVFFGGPKGPTSDQITFLDNLRISERRLHA
jgi:hypothetical protein